jgi:hypothetical protein
VMDEKGTALEREGGDIGVQVGGHVGFVES